MRKVSLLCMCHPVTQQKQQQTVFFSDVFDPCILYKLIILYTNTNTPVSPGSLLLLFNAVTV